jgi:hypothetical protein
MKKLIMIVMCVLISMTSYSKGGDELKVKGFYIAETNVKFEVSIVKNDDSRIVVQTKSSTFSYKIALKIGKEYVIKFMKGDVVKYLYISADSPGNMEVDVDFNSDTAAQLCYNDVIDDYHLTLIYKSE